MPTPDRALPALEISRTDDADVLAAARVNDFAGHVVPRSWRSSRLSLGMAWLSIFSAMFWLVFPASLSLAVGAVDTLVGMVLAAAVISLAVAVLAPYATRSGLTLTMFSQQLMGRRAGRLIGLVVGVTAIYYCAFEASVIALAFRSYFGGPAIEVWYAVAALMGIGLSLGGVRSWLDRFNGYLLPVYVVGLVGAIVWATLEYGYSSDWLTMAPPGGGASSVGPGWVLTFGAYLSQLVFIMFLWDFARMSCLEDTAFHARITFGLPTWLATFVLNGLAGIYLVNTIPIDGPLAETSVVLALISLMGFLGVALVWVTQSRIQTTNFYVSSLNLRSFFHGTFGLHWSRPVWAAVVGAVVFALMLTDVIAYLLTALNYQTVVVAGWIGVACAQVLRARAAGEDDASSEFRPGRLPAVHLAATLAWGLSALVGIGLLALTDVFGTTWAVPIVLVLAPASYLVLTRTLASVVPPRGADPRDEVADPWADRVRCGRCERSYLAVEMDRDPTRGGAAICAECAAASAEFLEATSRAATIPASPGRP